MIPTLFRRFRHWDVLLLLLGSNMALADLSYTAILERCAEQSLSTEQGQARNKWAYRCFPQARDYLDFFAGKNLVRYALVRNSEGSWDGPIDSNANCGTWEIKSFCLASCYTPEQKILFASGYMSIQEAVEKGENTLLVLESNSTLSKPKLRPIKVAFYTRSKGSQETFEIVRNIRTQSGKSVRITENHPVLLASSKLIPARELSVGDLLIQETGSPDPVTEITDENYQGPVYNLAPESEDLVENILIAQGLLFGSANYQSNKQFTRFMGSQIGVP